MSGRRVSGVPWLWLMARTSGQHRAAMHLAPGPFNQVAAAWGWLGWSSRGAGKVGSNVNTLNGPKGNVGRSKQFDWSKQNSSNLLKESKKQQQQPPAPRRQAKSGGLRRDEQRPTTTDWNSL